MSHFEADWLTLRQAADTAARDRAGTLLRRLRRARPRRGGLEAVDLGCGAGANLRYLGPRLGGRQRWTCVDRDDALLARLREGLAHGRWREASRRGCHAEVRLRRAHLRDGLRDIRPGRTDLVSASALLDLVGSAWLARLARRCARSRCAVLLALSVDGEAALWPQEVDDGRVLALVRAHQRRNKGLGTALGARAGPVAARYLGRRGYRVHGARSDWHLGASEGPLQRALIDGWVDAAAQVVPGEVAWLTDWRRRREAHLRAGTARIRVGHLDLLALPRRRSRRAQSTRTTPWEGGACATSAPRSKSYSRSSPRRKMRR